MEIAKRHRQRYFRVNSSSYIFIPIYQNLYFSCFLLINHQSSIINRNSVVEEFKFIDYFSVLLNFSCCFSYGSLFDHTKEMGQTGKYQVCTNAGNHRRIHISEVQRIIDGKKRRYINKTRGVVLYACYARVSSYEQKQKGDLDRQISRLRDYVDQNLTSKKIKTNNTNKTTSNIENNNSNNNTIITIIIRQIKFMSYQMLQVV
jgi:hypothetical protein